MALKTKQKDLIEYMVTHPMLPAKECYIACEVPERTYYDWKKNPEFMAELNRRIKEVWADGERAAVEAMQELARGGNYNACKYILDSLDYGAPQKVAVEGSLNTVIKVEIGDDSDEV